MGDEAGLGHRTRASRERDEWPGPSTHEGVTTYVVPPAVWVLGLFEPFLESAAHWSGGSKRSGGLSDGRRPSR